MSADLFAEFGFGQQQQQRGHGQGQQLVSLVGSSAAAAESESLPADDSDNLSWSEFQGPDQNDATVIDTSHEQGDNVLFNATINPSTSALPDKEEEEIDDWGEFETPEAALPRHDQQPVGGIADRLQAGFNVLPKKVNDMPDLLSMEDEEPVRPANCQRTSGAPAANKSAETKKMTSIHRTTQSTAARTPNDSFFDEWDDSKKKSSPPRASGPGAERSSEDLFDGRGADASLTKRKPKAAGVSKEGPSLQEYEAQRSSEDFFDEWGAGDSFTKGKPKVRARDQKRSNHDNNNHNSNSLLDVGSKKQSANRPPPQIRPTNIPPPSVLLQLFPGLFKQLHEEASGLLNEEQKSVLDDAAARICRAVTVSARVVVGRASRWKRDTILSQSMRIGPSRGGKPGGMKLNTVNKSENVKEAQEALDAIGAWRDHAGFFNAVMLAAGKHPIQPIAENSRVVTASPEKGALRAPHACALCGLKRDERIVGGVDDAVEDSFGEWWTEHWGHTDCKLFWGEAKTLLDHR